MDASASLPILARRALFRRLDQALQGFITFILARHRAVDDLILATPSDQVVFMGAGYDTRPARLCDRLHQSVVFEVDHPSTAKRKSELAAAVYADAELAPSVTVSIDFANESMESRLCEAGLDPDVRTVWVWEGVSMYLPEQAVRSTLKLFKRLSGSNSLVVCDVLTDPRRAGFLADAQTHILEVAMEWIYSEPFLWHCPQNQIASFFASCGLTVMEDSGLDELVGRYEQRLPGWWEATPSLRLVISEPS